MSSFNYNSREKITIKISAGARKNILKFFLFGMLGDIALIIAWVITKNDDFGIAGIWYPFVLWGIMMFAALCSNYRVTFGHDYGPLKKMAKYYLIAIILVGAFAGLIFWLAESVGALVAMAIIFPTIFIITIFALRWAVKKDQREHGTPPRPKMGDKDKKILKLVLGCFGTLILLIIIVGIAVMSDF